jgi:nitrite reductase/ring-hydroxylating ferredoxin subunit
MPDETSSKKRLWTEEFSVHASEDKYVLRRQFTKFLVLTSAGMLAGNVWIWVKSLFGAGAHAAFPEQAIGLASQIPVGGVKIFDYPGPDDNCILVRVAEDRFVAYSQKCTHLSCAVYYSAEQNRLECPCHEGYFSAENGRVLQGPPPRPLPRVTLVERGGQIYATGVDLGHEGA